MGILIGPSPIFKLLSLMCNLCPRIASLQEWEISIKCPTWCKGPVHHRLEFALFQAQSGAWLHAWQEVGVKHWQHLQGCRLLMTKDCRPLILFLCQVAEVRAHGINCLVKHWCEELETRGKLTEMCKDNNSNLSWWETLAWGAWADGAAWQCAAWGLAWETPVECLDKLRLSLWCCKALNNTWQSFQ